MTITANGRVKPCCTYSGPTDRLDRPGSLRDLLDSDKYSNLRQDFLAGQIPKGCHGCLQRERQIDYSRRVWFKEKFKEQLQQPLRDFQFIQMDINLSNICNLKCRMCNSQFSTRWISEEQELSKIQGNPYSRQASKENLNTVEQSLSDLKKLIPHMKNIKRIDFKGGEPMLAPNHNDFLDLLIANKISDRVELFYTTNATIMSEEILSRLKNFSKITISFSLEGIGNLYKYIRGGRYSLEFALENMRTYSELPNIRLASNVTIQAYNLFQLKEIYAFLEKLRIPNYSQKNSFQSIVTSPDYLSPFAWPKSLRISAAKRLEGIKDFKQFSEALIEQPEDSQLTQKFINFTSTLDQMRGESFSAICPEFELLSNTQLPSNEFLRNS